MLNFFLTVNKNFPKISRELKKFPENFPGFLGNQTNPILKLTFKSKGGLPSKGHGINHELTDTDDGHLPMVKAK